MTKKNFRANFSNFPSASRGRPVPYLRKKSQLGRNGTKIAGHLRSHETHLRSKLQLPTPSGRPTNRQNVRKNAFFARPLKGRRWPNSAQTPLCKIVDFNPNFKSPFILFYLWRHLGGQIGRRREVLFRAKVTKKLIFAFFSESRFHPFSAAVLTPLKPEFRQGQ